ncbi:DUF397 domain-containing protein [Micromonospora sp. KC213]|uniref:DUF397 domain-containing protein n=1 Tax=Micromonospora sp. KC213 TaxID=2530378 RepID=UPI00105401E1|nr:DUF397 domain-containing protein [Micromonospora sp. KC213]TDC32651.1 DUF397 domain-containing protein [Micromonospora sp. KC213]
MVARSVATSSSLPPVAWHVSTRSGSGGGNCVEAGPVLDDTGRVAVRDSKDRDGAVLLFDVNGWSSFLNGIRARKFKSC